MAPSRYLSSTEACSELGIRPQTLYSYVSRGLVRSESGDQRRRTRQYHREDIERLRRQKELRAHPEAAAGRALRAGDPVLESALSRIDDDDLYYRGISVGELARESTAEEVAALLWTGDRSRPIEGFAGGIRLEGVLPGLDAELAPLSAVERMQALLPVIGAGDPAAYATAPPRIHRSGARILRLMTLIAAGREQTRCGIAKTLQGAWLPGRPETTRLLEAALILCADHELNVSTFTCRTVASSGASLYAVVTAGLSALQGPRHGGSTGRLEALWDEAEANGAGETIASRLRRGDHVEGFGHVVYRGVDPRATILLELLKESIPEAPALKTAGALIEEVGKTDGTLPQRGPGAGGPAPGPGTGERSRPAAVLPRPDHRLDRPRHGAVPDRPPHTAAREIHGTGSEERELSMSIDQMNHYQRKLAYEMDSWDLYEALGEDEPITVIDGRSAEAYAEEHIPGALSLPHRGISLESTRSLDKSRVHVCYCDGIGCNASTKTALKLLTLGFQVRELIGGLDWWKRDGYATAGTGGRPGTEIRCGC